MAGQFISKEQQKKAPLQWGQFIPKWTVNVPIREVKPRENILKRWAVVAWWLWGAYAGGKVLESVGRKVYWVTLPPPIDEAKAIQSYKAGTTNVRPRTSTDVLLDLPVVQKTPLKEVYRSPTSTLWWMWSRSMIWEQAERAANNIFKKINPIFDKLDKVWIKMDTQSLIQRAKDSILKSKKYAPSQIKEIVENIDEIAKNIEPSLSVKQLDLEKQALASKIPQKYQTMPKLPNEARVAQKELASIFRKAVHTTVKKMSWVDSAKLYHDWASLKGVSEIWPKSLTQAWRKWGAWTFLSWLSEELATPVTTTAWKLTYKLWKWMQALPKKLREGVKASVKGMSAKDIAKWVIREMPAWILSELFWRQVSKVASWQYAKEQYKEVLDKIRRWERLWIKYSPITTMIKWLDKKDAILLLEKLSQ